MIKGKKISLLIIDDDREIVALLKHYFSEFNLLVNVAYNLQSALDLVKEQLFEFVLLDLNLPDGNGFSLLDKLQQFNYNGSVIILSGNDGISEKIYGLNNGSDDFFSKPFNLQLLTSRIRNLYRSKHAQENHDIIFNEITLNLREHSAFVNKHKLQLTQSEFDLLLFLIDNASKVVTREAIRRYLYRNKFNINDSREFIYTHIKNLKRKIGQYSAIDYLKTVHNVGYTISM